MERHADGELPPVGKPEAIPVCERREPAGRGAAPRVLTSSAVFRLFQHMTQGKFVCFIPIRKGKRFYD